MMKLPNNPIQTDLFETEEQSYLRSLREKKRAVKAELDVLNHQIREVISKGSNRHLGLGIWLGKLSSGQLFLYGEKKTTLSAAFNDGRDTEFFSPVSIDLLRKAVEELTLGDTNDPSRIPGSNAGQPSQSPW
jgi:hypothetical protein